MPGFCAESMTERQIDDMLCTLKQVYHLEDRTLCTLLGVDAAVINDFPNHMDAFQTPVEFRRFSDRLLMLHSVAYDEPDFKVAAYLQVLLNYHHISKKSVAAFAGVTEEDITAFLNDGANVPTEKKYRIANTVMCLRFLFKEAEPALS